MMDRCVTRTLQLTSRSTGFPMGPCCRLSCLIHCISLHLPDTSQNLGLQYLPPNFFQFCRTDSARLGALLNRFRLLDPPPLSTLLTSWWVRSLLTTARKLWLCELVVVLICSPSVSSCATSQQQSMTTAEQTRRMSPAIMNTFLFMFCFRSYISSRSLRVLFPDSPAPLLERQCACVPWTRHVVWEALIPLSSSSSHIGKTASPVVAQCAVCLCPVEAPERRQIELYSQIAVLHSTTEHGTSSLTL